MQHLLLGNSMLVQQESKFFVHRSHLHPIKQVAAERIPGIQ